MNLVQLVKISSKFHHWNQAVMDELIEDYLQTLADDYQCEVIELAEYLPMKDLHRMITTFKKEIEIIWEEESNE
jgi:hypothetical protein